MAFNRELSQFASFVEVGISSVGIITSVGIGTTAPTSRLHVIGDALIVGVTTSNAYLVGATQVISSGRQLQNIDSLDAITTATIESAIANAPNTFTDLNVTGISTLGVTSTTNLTAQQLNVTGVATVASNLLVNGGTLFVDALNNRVAINTTTPIQPFQVGSGSSIVVTDNQGRLGIGTTNPTSSLTVQGNGLFTGIITASSFSGNASTATYATTAGVSTSVIGGIGSITSLSVSGVTTTSTLNVGTGGTVITTTSSGLVGIGTINPTDKLTVSGKIQIQQDSGSNNRLIFRGQPGSFYRWNIDNFGSSNDFRIFREDDATAANGSVAVSISTTGTLTANKFSGDGSLITGIIVNPAGSDGQIQYNNGGVTGGASQFYYDDINNRVGIGTTNPQYRTHIFGSDDILALESTSSTVRTTLKLITNGNDWEVGARGSASSPANAFYIYDNAASQFRQVIDSFGNVLFGGSTTATGTSSQALQVNSGGYFNGSVGIGTTNPTSKLHVVGDVIITGVTTSNSFRARGGAPGALGVNNNGYGFFGSGDNDSGMYSSADGQIEFYSNSVEAARITNNRNLLIGIITETGTSSQALQVNSGGYFNGSVGIGTTNPIQRLHVIGNGLFTGIVTASQFSTGSGFIGITTNTITGPSELIIDPAAVGDNTGSVRIKGDLYVDGTQTIINSTTIELADFNVGIATTVGTNALLDGAGIGIGSTGIRKTITWNNTAGALTSSEDWNLASGKVYEIGGTNVLSSTTLGSGVVNSSLTSVGTLGQLNVSGITTSSRITLTGAGDTTTGGGQIYLNGATGNRIDFNINGVAAPTFTTRSVGTKIVLYPAIAGSAVDYALGIEGGNGTLWYSIPNNISTLQHRWYAGTTQLADLKGSGELIIGTTNITGTTAQRLQVNGGAYVSGNTGIGTTNPTSRLHVVGDVLVSGIITSTDYNSTSDLKLKTNVQTIEDPLSKVMQLNGVSFNWKENNRPSMGVIAQEVEKVLPDLVSGDETKTVNYNGLIGLLIECIKEQQKEIDVLKQRLL